MSGTIVVDRIESDASYASSINIASPIQISNTITGNVNFDSGTLFVDSVGNKIGAGTTTPAARLHLEGTGGELPSRGIRLAYDGTYYADIVQEGAGGLSYRTYGGLAHKWQQSGTTVMNIDGSGRVTMPYQPLFSVRKAGSGNSSVNSGHIQTIFTDVDINVGSSYNTSTGRFTAPISGYYFFHLIVYYSAAGLSYVGASIRRQDGRVHYGFLPGGPDATATVSCITYLNANDYVYSSTYPSANTTISDNNSWFSGYLIS